MQDTREITRDDARPAALERIPEKDIIEVDVREDLRNGREPFQKIMTARDAVPDGGALRVRAIFEPVPLYRVMAKHGFDHWTERLADDDWRGPLTGESPASGSRSSGRRRGDRSR